MERKISLIVLVTLFYTAIHAQVAYRSQIYDCYVNNKMQGWKNIIDEMEKKQYQSNSLKLELLNYQYGYIGWCLGNDMEDEAEEYLDIAVGKAEYLAENHYQTSSIYAYKSALWGFKIGLAYYKAPFIGPESIKFAEKAIALDKDNYLGYLQLGNIEYYMPSTFGGSKSLALEYYLKAEQLIIDKTNNWNYLSLMITIAQAYSGIDEYEKAKLYYEKILNIEPQFKWVKNELLPQLNIKIKENE